MATCPHCNEPVETGAAFCGACGHRLASSGGIPAADPLIGLIIDGRYRIIDLIGRGGMGAVYRAEHVKMGKIMALKLLHGELSMDAEVARRFQREARAASKLTHVNNVSIFDFGTYNGMMYLVMEYIDGKDLSDIVREEGPLPLARVLEILAQVCSGLMDAHAQGIVHRDLKPENIISCQGQDEPELVKVVDFGLAKLRAGRPGTKITRQGSLVGTPYYMAPEHIREEEVDARTDVYALGAVMHKLLTGETPFTANNTMGVITKHLTEEVVPPSTAFPSLNIPPEADAIILKAMSKAPSDRYASAEEMRAALADLAVTVDPSSSLVRFTAGITSRIKTHSDTPVSTPVPAGRQITRPATITIGAREIGVGTKSEVIRYERGIRRKRVVSFLVLALLGAALVGGGGYYFVFHGLDDSMPTAETEPNDSSERADTLTAGVQLAGRLGGGGAADDADWYRLDGPEAGPWAVTVSVTGVPGADIAIQLIDPARAEPVALVNRGAAGVREEIFPTIVSASTLYLVVREIRAAGVPPGDFSATPYGVTYRMFDASTVEAEPNDRKEEATAAALGSPLQGRFDSAKDADWYCLPAGAAATVVQVSGPAGVDVVLDVYRGGGFPTTSDLQGAGGGESAAVPAGQGSVCVRVSAKDGSTDTVFYPYQVIFQ